MAKSQLWYQTSKLSKTDSITAQTLGAHKQIRTLHRPTTFSIISFLVKFRYKEPRNVNMRIFKTKIYLKNHNARLNVFWLESGLRTRDVLSFNQMTWSVQFVSRSGQMVEARPCLNNMMQWRTEPNYKWNDLGSGRQRLSVRRGCLWRSSGL